MPAAVAIAALATASGGAARAQQTFVPGDGPWVVEWGASQSRQLTDTVELTFTGGLRLTQEGLRLRADRGLVILDSDTVDRALEETSSRGGLPRRGTSLPGARRRIDEGVLRSRMERFLGATGRAGVGAGRGTETGEPDTPSSNKSRFWIPRSIYLEGNVVLEQDGVEVMRADTFYYSVVDDRGAFEGVTLRFRAPAEGGTPTLLYTLRAPRLIREGTRVSGRDASLTTCTAGVPHYELVSGEIEIIEREDAFEIRSRGNRVAFHRGISVPLPNVSFFTDDQNPVPLKRIAVRWSERQGAEVDLLFGSNWNEFGGSIHEAVTGRDSSQFRGRWELGVGWNDFRGVPLDGQLTYEADGMYRGRIEGFHLQDRGNNLREIQFDRSGNLIDEDNRNLLRTENRFFLPWEGTTLDLTVFDASDPAVWSEFYPNQYYQDERLESSAYLRNQRANRLATLGGRWNLAGFSYDDDRTLEPAFREELPVGTYDVYSQPIFELPGGNPVTLTSSTSVGEYSLNADNDEGLDRDLVPVRDRPRLDPMLLTPRALTTDARAVRIDQELELATQARFAGMGFRPFFSGRAIHYDRTAATDESNFTRGLFEAGVVVGTRLARTFEWDGKDGRRALQHAIHPTLEISHRFEATGSPADFYQFDEVDALDENAAMRIGLLQRFATRESAETAKELGGRPEFLWLDLAQNVFPISERDNQGEQLGLFEFEAILRPQDLLPLPPNFQILVEGEHDWNESELRTFNTYVAFDVEKFDVWGQYRTDRTEDGVIGAGASRPLFDRWLMTGSTNYDLEGERILGYQGGLVRLDHDWSMIFTVSYDFVTAQTSVNMLFQPRLGGATSAVRTPFLGDPRVRGRATNF